VKLHLRVAICLLGALCSFTGRSVAAQLSVGPVLLELTAPAAAATLTLVNNEDHEITVQTRVLRWSQRNGEETLEPTTDVVASPPSITLAPDADYTIRIVRTSKRPVEGEESYRVLVDQLPDYRRAQSSGVNMLIRQSIPVFFRATQSRAPDVSWSLSREGINFTLRATNRGDTRLRIASLKIRDATGKTISLGDGLVGYVLGNSSMTWPIPYLPYGFGETGGVRINAQTQNGEVDQQVELRVD
jgi:fimbrial chaperone protein